MPTFQRLPRFDRDWDALTAAERRAFRTAVALFLDGLRGASGRFHPRLRVHRIDGTEDIWSLSFGDDARATFQYGEPIRAGEPHIVWRRVGSHRIYRRP